MKTTMIKPGLLVGLTSEVTGGVSYQRKDMETDPDPRVSRWETTKVTDDPEELQRASAARSAARSAITRVCIVTPFGLLCPQDRIEELDAAVTEAERIVAAHNASALHTWVSISVLPGEIAASSERANRALAAQMGDLVDQMRLGLESADPAVMRESAAKAKSLSAMLAPAQEEAALAAVEEVRRAAREVTRRVEKGGEEAALVLETLSREALTNARMAFLDLDEPTTQPQGEALPGASIQRFACLGLLDGEV